MNRTKIEYLKDSGGRGYCWNFQTGCRHTLAQCPCADQCWARTTAKRFGQDFTPTLHPEKLLEPLSVKKPARIGVCFTGDLFGEWVDPNRPIKAVNNGTSLDLYSLSGYVQQVITKCPQHRFLFLTKAPQNYHKWGQWPTNAWLGASVCNNKMMSAAYSLCDVKGTDKAWTHRWLSIEPLMERLEMGVFPMEGVWDWVVIGGWSRGTTNQPKVEWVADIVEACKAAGIPYWIKDNLSGLDVEMMVTPLHHELPEGVR